MAPFAGGGAPFPPTASILLGSEDLCPAFLAACRTCEDTRTPQKSRMHKHTDTRTHKYI